MLSIHSPFFKDISSERCFPSSSRRWYLLFQSTYINIFISFSTDLDYVLSHNQKISHWVEDDEQKERAGCSLIHLIKPASMISFSLKPLFSYFSDVIQWQKSGIIQCHKAVLDYLPPSWVICVFIRYPAQTTIKRNCDSLI